jgi:hypothetical protein
MGAHPPAHVGNRPGYIAPRLRNADWWATPFWGGAPYYGGYGAGYYGDTFSQSPAQPATVILVMPAAPPPPEPPPAPASPARAETKEYSWTPRPDAASAPFAIVLKDGTVQRALTLCRQETLLTYVTPDGAGRQVNLTAVDEEATRRANAR